jgi:translocation and assembly module TamB
MGASLGLTAVFVASMVGAILLHLDLGPTRRTVQRVVNQVFAESFKGTLVVGEIDRLNLHGLSIRGAKAFDPSGAQVVDAVGLQADADVMAIVKSAVAGTGDLRILVSLVHVDHADVALERGPDGEPTIADVFLPRRPAPPAPPGGRKPRITLERIELGHLWVHGGIVQPAGLDSELGACVGRFEVSPDGIAIDVEPSHLDVRAPLPQPLAGSAVFKLHGDAGGGGTKIEGGFEGRIGGLDVLTDAKLIGTRLTARVEIPHATAEAIASLVPLTPPPAIPLRRPVSALIEAEGDLPDIAFKTKLAFDGGGSVSADGKVALRSPFTLDVGVKVSDVDPRVALDVPSATPVGAVAHVYLEAGTDLRIDAEASTQPFFLAGNPIPAVDVKATLAHGLWSAAATVDEQGAPVHGTFTFDPKAKNLGFAVEARVASLRGLKRVPLPVDGNATVKVTGSLRDGSLDARVTARAGGIRAAPGAVALESGGVDGHLTGPLGALQVDASVWGSGLQAGFYAWEGVKAHIRGPLLAPRVDATLDSGNGEALTASGAVDAASQSIRDIKVDLTRNKQQVGGRVAKVSFGPGGIQVEGIALTGTGIGELRGGLVVRGKEITGKLRGEDVDLEKLAHLASYPGHLGGLANVDVDLSSSGPGSRRGHVAVELVDGETALVHGVSGTFTATFEGDRVRADGLLRVVSRAGENEKPSDRCDGAIAQIRVSDGEGRLPGPLLDPRSWMGVSGKIELAADEWRLRCIRRLVPSFVPVPELHGKLTTRVKVERAPGARLPTVKSFFARTKGLAVVDANWQSLHTDVQIDASLDGSSGETDAKVTVLDGDPLASVAVGAKLDLLTLLDHPEQRWASIKRAPLRGSVTIPRRAITAFSGLPSFVTDALPILTGKDGQTLTGEIQVDGKLTGTLLSPLVEEHVRAFKIAQVVLIRSGSSEQGAVEEPVLGPFGLPVDAAVDTTYDGHKVSLVASAENQARAVIRAKADLELPIADLLEGRVTPKGSFHASLDKVPVGDVPYFADRGVVGQLSGAIDVDGLGTRPKVRVKLDTPNLTVGRVTYDDAQVSLDMDEPQPTEAGSRSTAKLQATLKGGNGGTFSTSVSQQLSWKNGLVPALDPQSPGQLDVKATRFRLAVAEPFLDNIVSSLDGFLDGEAHVSFKPGKQGGVATRLGNVDFALTKGVVNLPQLGQELHGLTLRIARDETGRVLFKDIQAQGTRGLVKGSGSAEFTGLVPKQANVVFNIDRGDALPVSYEGAPIGDVSGVTRIDVKLVPEKPNGALKAEINVAINPLFLELSPALTRSLTVEKSADNPNIVILHSKLFDDLSSVSTNGSTKIDISFTPLNLSMKGKLFGRMPVAGKIVASKEKPVHVVIGGRKPRISGLLLLPRFTIEVLHKEFVIEDGKITLDPDDVEKSFINISARWDSPDGSVFVDFAGDLTQLAPDKLQDKLKCRAQNMSQERCMAALVFGTDQGSAQGGGQAQQGQALAAQVLASEFSTEIAGGISTNIGTGDDGSFRPGLVYKTGNLTTELSTYGAGSATSTTTSAGAAAPKGQHSLLTVDWRFWRNWSLRGKVDVGSDLQTYGADVLWQYRY